MFTISSPAKSSVLSGQYSFPQVECFTNSLQYKNANIAHLLLAVPLEINYTNKV